MTENRDKASPEQSGAGEEEVKRYCQMGSAMVETFNTFDGKPSGAWVSSQDYDRLRSQLDSVRKEKMDWIAANAPGGWIDDLRKKAEAAEQRARDIREECARKVAALRADWEKRLGKGGEFWDGYTSFAKACLKAIMGV